MRQQGDSKQIVGTLKAHYELAVPPSHEPRGHCRNCGREIIKIGDRWFAVRSPYPNLAHCHYSARDYESVGHSVEI